MFQGLSDFGHAFLGFMHPMTLAYGRGGAFVGIVMGILPGLSATLAKEYGKKGITSNVISPGFFETDMTRAGMSDANRAFWLQYNPLGRLGELPELAKLVAFLASPGADYINGQEIRVDGGLGWAP